MKKLGFAIVVFLTACAALAAPAQLSITKAGPIGEVATLAEANEIRIIFSEPMVAVGKVPANLTVPWFHVAPAIDGKFRWSGTTTLIFTPTKQLPFATKYDVTIDADAKAVSGKTLSEPYTFSFLTPTIKLTRSQWYREPDGSVVIGLRFNQTVDPQVVVQHLQVKTTPHEFKEPDAFSAAAAARLNKLEPKALTDFKARLDKATAAAASNGTSILSFLPEKWDQKRLAVGKDLVVLQTKPNVPNGMHLVIYLDGELAAPGNVKSGHEQQFTVELNPIFFVNKADCLEECNPERSVWIEFRSQVSYDELSKAVTVRDISDPAHEVTLKPKKAEKDYPDANESFSLDELGYSIVPAHTYAVRIDPSLQTDDGQTLGYTWMEVVEFWHRSAFISFGDGHGVWETSGGPQLPFYARNYVDVKQWIAPVSVDQLMPTILRLQPGNFNIPPDTKPVDRKLAVVRDKTQSFGINVAPTTGPDLKGLLWVAVLPGQPVAKSKPAYEDTANQTRATLVQVTNLGISVKDSPQNTLVLVTRLDDARPVEGAKVSIRTTDNKVFWTGTTDARGIAIAPNTNLRIAVPTDEEKKKAEAAAADDAATNEEQSEPWEDQWKAMDSLHFVVTAEKDGDTAYVASDWHEGISPYDFSSNFNLNESDPLLRGTVFTDRGVYKPGEEVHMKAVLRSDTPRGVQLLPAGTKIDIIVRNSRDEQVDKRIVVANDWSGADWTWKVPTDGALGTYSILLRVKEQRLRIFGDFLVAAYRRPEFRVDATLKGASSIAGTKLDGTVTGRYLFGSPMSALPVEWTYSRSPLYTVPSAITERFQSDQWEFLGQDAVEHRDRNEKLSTKQQKLTAKGELKLSLPTDVKNGWPYAYTLEGEVTDVSRQKIANRASFRVDPAPWYIGIKSPPYFAEAQKGLDSELVAAGLDGLAVEGVEVKVTLTQVQYNSVRTAAGNGFYTWDTERKEVPAGEWTVKTAAQPVPLHVPLPNGGEYIMAATAADAAGHTTTTSVSFYAVGAGYTAWARYDHNRIDLVPEKDTYKPGDTARIMIKSPWEHATALLTTEREGVRTSKQFELTSTQQTVTVPIAEGDIPNVYVSVLLLRGRTKGDPVEGEETDPGKPAFRLGYTMLKVEDMSKELKVGIKANHEEYRPATKAKIDVDVKDMKGKGSQSEVTLWAVDYGVLSLTDYKTPKVLDSIYLEKALQVINDESREKIISRRVLTPKGADAGGGGGADAGPGMIRKDFRVLAFWLGSITTDKNGHAHTEVTLPESLTTYRIMAVAGDRASRFGWAQNEIRINKPVLLTQTFPRFLAVGDKAYFGAVVHSQLKQNGKATVTFKSLNPEVLEMTGETKSTADVTAGGSAEVRFNATAKSVGDARVQVSVSLNGETDAFEDVIPVRILLSPETFAAYGEAKPDARETLEIPAGVAPGFGGLHLDLSSTAMVGLGEGARYLVDYPYGCAEQRSSAAFALMLASDLGDSFKLPGIDPTQIRTIAQTTVSELPKFQCGSGGFTYWAGECQSDSPYLTSYVLHVLQRAQKLKYNVDSSVMERAYTYLDKELAKPRPENEGWWPAYTAWQAFAIKVLAEGGRNQDGNINRLYTYIDRMPVFGIAYLEDALVAKGETKGPRFTELHRRMSNAILPEGGSAHVEELSDPYLLWFWSSNVRSTAITLGTLVRSGNDEDISKRMVRWMMAVRKQGRWGNTQENAWAMEALVDYYRKYESETPDFTAVVTLGSEKLASDSFKGRSTEAKPHDIPMQQLLTKGSPEQKLPIDFARQGTGTLFYALRLRYASTFFQKDPLDQGFTLERHYALQNGKADQTTFKAGDLIKVTLNIRNTKERRFVAVTDPIPAGTEPVESWFATTASALAEDQQNEENGGGDWMSWWQHGGFDHVERHDDRVDLFATRLSEGPHVFSYVLRATTAGSFVTAPMHAEEMYEPEVFGRTSSAQVEIKP